MITDSVSHTESCSIGAAKTPQIHFPMLAQCWASVEDGGPTLNHHWVYCFVQFFNDNQAFNPYSAGTDFSRQNLTSIDVRF